MQEKGKNAFGMDGCDLPNGKKCRSCSDKIFRITDPEFGDHGFHKEQGVLCPFLSLDQEEGGCTIYANRPKPCRAYHCSQDNHSPKIQATIIAIAYRQGLITKEEAMDAGSFFPAMDLLLNLNNSSGK